METKEQRKEEAIARRHELQELSKSLKALAKMQENDDKVNDLLLDYYITQGVTELNTYEQWQKKGYQVKKGERSYLMWGKPISTKKVEEKETADNEENKDFFPVCHLFDKTQVHPISNKSNN